jgi:hypothetical protein
MMLQKMAKQKTAEDWFAKKNHQQFQQKLQTFTTKHHVFPTNKND